MAKQIKLQPTKTYATEANAVKAVEKHFPADAAWASHLTYFIMPTQDGRFFPVFIGERAIQAMVHFKFHVVA